VKNIYSLFLFPPKKESHVQKYFCVFKKIKDKKIYIKREKKNVRGNFERILFKKSIYLHTKIFKYTNAQNV